MTTTLNTASIFFLIIVMTLLTTIWFGVRKLNKSRMEEGLQDDEIEMDAPNTNIND